MYIKYFFFVYKKKKLKYLSLLGSLNKHLPLLNNETKVINLETLNGNFKQLINETTHKT